MEKVKATEQLRLIRIAPSFGCDPEFFFTRTGSKSGKEYVVGAEKVMPKGAISTYCHTNAIVIDGVQAEMNPRASTCRANLGNDLQRGFIALRDHLNANGSTIKASFSSVVKVTKKEMDSLGEKAKVFGCAPSINAYDKEASIKISGATYRKRAAGGHIHLGLNGAIKEKYDRLATIMDIIVGNTCVMIDRDPEQVERRKYYGRAGEYRTPPHGFEYRTLSNFWLRSYQLMSLVMGLSRMAIAVMDNSPEPVTNWDAETKLLSLVDVKDVRKAINENDLDLAIANWQKIRPFIEAHAPQLVGDYAMGIPSQLVDAFEYFCKKVQEKGLEYWFPQEPLEHWCNMSEGHGTGWESFLSHRVNEEYKKSLEKKVEGVG